VTGKRLKNESSRIMINSGSSCRTCCPDRDIVNGSSNRYHMKNTWLAKVLVDFSSLGRLNGDTIWKFSSGWNRTKSGRILGKNCHLIKSFPLVQIPNFKKGPYCYITEKNKKKMGWVAMTSLPPKLPYIKYLK